MYRPVFLLVVAALSVCWLIGPAAADNTSSYYDGHLASRQIPDPPAVVGADDSGGSAVPSPQPVNDYPDAFTETTPSGDSPSPYTTPSDEPVAAFDDKEMGDKEFYDGGCDGKCGKGSGCDCWCPRWRFTFDTLVLRREHMDAVPLIVGPAGVLLDADDIGLSHRAGLRLAASRQIDCCRDIEFEFFFVDQWSAVTTVADPGTQFTVYGAAFGVSPLTLGYGNDLYSFELNWRRAWGSGRIKTLMGFRIMELDENMTGNDAVSPPPLFEGDIDNHLIGFQVGLEGIIYKSCRWEIEGGTKFGIYHNSADFDAAFPQAGPAAVFNAAEDHTTFSGEVWLGVNYYLTDCLALRAGYQAMWIEGVAILPEQLDDLAVPILGDLDMGGSPFYHGAYFGAQVDW